jgi:hypothetical protein
MEATRNFSRITTHISTATASEHVQSFCKVTGHKVLIHHNQDGRIMLRVSDGRWSSPCFGSASELIGYCAAMLSGFTAQDLSSKAGAQ